MEVDVNQVSQDNTLTADLDKNNTKIMHAPKEAECRRVILLTGATGGMGVELLKELAIQGHIIIAVGRDPTYCKRALALAKVHNPKAEVQFCVADMSVMAQVKVLADDIAEKLKKLKQDHIDVIYHNVVDRTNNIQHTYERHELQWATNYLSVVLLTELMLPYLKKSDGARVITVTNEQKQKQKINFDDLRTAKNAKNMFEYSKLADLMYAMQFNEEYRDTKICAYSVYPGNILSVQKPHRNIFERIWDKIRGNKVVSLEDGVKTSLHLITAPHLPAKVVLYHNYRPMMPCPYALSPFNRKKLWRATRTILGLN